MELRDLNYVDIKKQSFRRDLLFLAEMIGYSQHLADVTVAITGWILPNNVLHILWMVTQL